MTEVSEQEIQQDVRAYLRLVESGETIVIVRAGRPVAEIRPLPSSTMSQRPYGLCRGDFVVPDDFDAPLPENVIQGFEGL